MNHPSSDLTKIQQLVLDIIKIERYHCIPETERHENVVEHSFSLTLLCWKLFETLKPPLSLIKIFKYALVHDFSERGYKKDVNAYASKDERHAKKIKEKEELDKISKEFCDFEDMVRALVSYELMDEEARFVWAVDKIAQIILGQMDNWRPYRSYGIDFKSYCAKNEEFISKCSPYVKDVFRKVYEDSKETYYDQL